MEKGWETCVYKALARKNVEQARKGEIKTKKKTKKTRGRVLPPITLHDRGSTGCEGTPKEKRGNGQSGLQRSIRDQKEVKAGR